MPPTVRIPHLESLITITFLPFQVLFHHLIELVEDIGTQMVSSGFYSIHFEQRGVLLYLHVRFWKWLQICRVSLLRTGRTTGQTSAEIRLLCVLLSAISCKAQLVCCSGCPLGFLKLIDTCPFFKYGIQCTTRFDDLSLAKLMHKQSYSGFGRIDFFSVVQHFVISLSGSLQYEWTVMAPALTKVYFILSFRVHCPHRS